MGLLDNKVAVITGGISGMGLATARLFKREGATVVVNARNETRRKEVEALEGEAFDKVAVADIANLAELQNFYEKIGERLGQIDVLFLNAGMAGNMPLEAMTEEFYDAMMDTNLKGVLFSVKYALPFLSQGSSIILTTSVNNQMGQAMSSVYSASKAAVRSLARTLSAELAPRGIRVNAISPGPIDTDLVSKLGFPPEMLPAIREQVTQMTALKRWGQPEEIARVALFFATEMSSYVIGTELEVDGGMATL